VDGAQSVGAIPVDARDLDYMTISGQKWLCGPESTGALVVADPAQLRVARPSYFSQETYRADGSFEPWSGARRFDPGWLPTSSLSGLLAAVRGRPEWCFSRSREMAEACRRMLEGTGVEVATPKEQATIVSWRSAEPVEVVAHLESEGVLVREIPKTGLVRASIGWWTNDDDLERLANGLKT
jgi:L-cysteine/cystine lyase